MNYRLDFLLLCFSVLGGTSSDDPLERVNAFVGLPAILPCKQNLPGDSDIPTIEWSKAGLKPSPYVFVYRNYDMFEEKHEDFKFRTHLFMTLLHKGNFSMRLSDVRESDKGMYLCKTIRNKGDKREEVIKTVELAVGIIPTPELSVVSIGGGSVNLSCEVLSCFLNLPSLTLRDGDGRTLKVDKDQVLHPNESGCYRLQQHFTAPTSARSVVCRAEFAEIGQSRDAHLLIPEGVKESCTFPMIYAGVGTGLVVILINVGVGFLIHKFCCKSDDKKTIHQQSSVDTTTSSGSETRNLLHQDSSTIEMEETGVTTMSSEPPDLICSTPNSTVSKADSRTISVFDFLADVTDNAAGPPDARTPTCEINGASKSVKFEQKEEERCTKLTRQDAISPQKSFPKPALSSGIRKTPVRRTQSVSDSCSTALDDLKTQCRRYSLSGSKFDKLLEEP